MNNYPPGVTGNEFQITGPLEEWQTWFDCPECGIMEQHVDAWWHPDTGAWATCLYCEREVQLADPREPDPDEAYELRRDLEWEAQREATMP